MMPVLSLHEKKDSKSNQRKLERLYSTFNKDIEGLPIQSSFTKTMKSAIRIVQKYLKQQECLTSHDILPKLDPSCGPKHVLGFGKNHSWWGRVLEMSKCDDGTKRQLFFEMHEMIEEAKGKSYLELTSIASDMDSLLSKPLLRRNRTGSL